MSSESEEDPNAAALAVAVATLPSRPAALPADSHLRGSENYDVWCIQIRGLVGPDAYRVMTGELTRHRPAPLTSAEWPASTTSPSRRWSSPARRRSSTSMTSRSHLLAALPSLLAALQTTIAVANQSALPKPDTILDIVRNEVLRTAPAGGSIALAAGAADPPLPSPCPACKANHWLRVCPQRDEYRGRRGNRRPVTLAALLNDRRVYSMCGDAALFANLRPCTPSPVGGISNQNGLKVTGAGTLLLRLASGRIVKLNGALLVPGISTTLISSAQLYDLHGVTSTFAKHATLARDNVVLAPTTPASATVSAGLTASSPTRRQASPRLAHLAPRSLKSLAKSGDVTGLDIIAGQAVGNEPCNVCHVAHSLRLPIPHSSRSMCAPLEVVPSDVLSVNVPSLSVRR
ncbi:hypothetical protein JCM3770_007030 [Rhodotorula araucariae]